jgi:hypothetical protein
MIIWIIIVAVFLIAILVIKDKKKEKENDKIQLTQNSENIKNKSEKNESQENESQEKKFENQFKDPNLDMINNQNYIYPKPFRASSLLIRTKPYYAMNNCDSSVLYPINALDINYGSKFPDCRCTEYVQAP